MQCECPILTKDDGRVKVFSLFMTDEFQARISVVHLPCGLSGPIPLTANFVVHFSFGSLKIEYDAW